MRTLGYDDAGRIRSYTHTNGSGVAQPAFDQSFDYDGLDRLTQNVQASTSYGYGYDLSHNRTSQAVGGSTTTNTIATNSNRLLAEGTAPPFTYHADGSINSDGTNTFNYSDRGRLASVDVAAGRVKYVYNAIEQRVAKSSTNAALVEGNARAYVYDEPGHLIGEYDSASNPLYEVVYLNDTPVAVITQTRTGSGGTLNVVTKLSYLYADHLDTPRVIVRATDHAIQWRWDQADAFGNAVPNENPNSLGLFSFNLRFPGQIFDNETSLAYNVNRDYRAKSGRYVQSDPIGLGGGINTYLYANAAPTMFTDPDGKFAIPLIYWAPPVIAGAWWWLTGPPAPMERTPPRWWPSMPEGDAEFCRQERRRCAELCEEAECKPDFQNIWGGSIDRCIRGCLPAKCGGNKTGR